MPTRYPLDPASPAAASVREVLRARQRSLAEDIAATRDASLTRGDEVLDRKDEATQVEFNEIGDAEVERDVGELREIAAALQRLEDGRYGLCLDCDEPIDARRLQAEPFAVRCAPCQTQREQARRR